MDKKYSTFPGKFICHVCKEEVKSARLWLETIDMSWMCSKKHISKVAMVRQSKYSKRKGGV